MVKVLRSKLFKPLIYCVILAIILLIIINVDIINEIFSLIIFSFILSYSLKPIQRVLIERGISVNISSLVLILSVIISLILIFVVLIPSVFKESLSLGSSLDEIEIYISGLYHKLKLIENNKTIYSILTTIYSKMNVYLTNIFNNLLEATADLGENVLAFVIVPIMSYYFLSDSEYIESKLLLFCPLKGRAIIKRINKDIDKILGRYIMSQFMLCVMVSILTFFVLILLRVKFPIILSILNGILNIIPYFGPIFGMIPAIIIALLTSTKTAMYTAILLYSIQLIEGNILSPKITGDSVSMHPLAVILILLIGGELGGFWGMVLAVPISVILKVIYEDLNYYLF